jgi:hypothetical protein
MNRRYLLDSLDGLKALVFRLLPKSIAGSIACVPMTTDGPWTDAEKQVFETAIGIPGERTCWTPGAFVNVPPSSDPAARSRWLAAVAAINHPYLFLDPDIGFFSHHTSDSKKMLLVDELEVVLRRREVLIVYRHQYWPNSSPSEVPPNADKYVWHGLCMLRTAGLAAFAYQSQAASCFFVSKEGSRIDKFQAGLRLTLHGVSADVINRRVVV